MLRERAGMTQEQLAATSGLRRTEISAHENGKRAGASVLSRLAAGLGVTVAELRGGPAMSRRARLHAIEEGEAMLARLERLQSQLRAELDQLQDAEPDPPTRPARPTTRRPRRR